MTSIEERIAALEQKLKQLKVRRQLLDSRRKRLESQRARKADTRRKILVGAAVLGKVQRGEIAEAQLQAWLDGALTRADDRALFQLSAKDRVKA